MPSARVPRPSVRRRRARALPSVSRIILRPDPPAAPPLGKSSRLVDALRASREALADIQGQLDELLAAVRAPAGRPEPDAADRLRRATKRAGTAVNRLAEA
jgi:hypothetical protein